MRPQLITFVLLAYNQRSFIREAVAGALAQTYTPLEIILSDDGSSDGTFEVIQELASAYVGPNRIVLNRNEKNLGLCAHVNKVFAMATGEWVVLAAGDDISYPERCERLHEAVLRTPDATAVTSAWEKIDEQGNRMPLTLPRRFVNGRIDAFGDTSWVDNFIHGRDIGVNGASSMWLRKLIDEFGPIPTDVPAEDAILSFRAYLTGSVVYTNEKLMRYRSHSGNISAFCENDIGVIEGRRQDFSRRSLATVVSVEKDYQTYVTMHPEACNVRVAGKLTAWGFYLQERRSEWWERSIGWRILKIIDSLRSHNWVEFRWSIKRLAGKRPFILLQRGCNALARFKS